jgi:uncharacterized membrane protein
LFNACDSILSAKQNSIALKKNCMLPEPIKYKATAQPNRFNWKKVIQYFLQGLVILAPIGLTVWALVSLFNSIDRIIPGMPPGVGFVAVLAIIIVVGYLSTVFIAGRIFDLIDNILERTPGIKTIYTTVKDFIEAFAGNKRKFNKPVLVALIAPDVWQVGFVTQDDMAEFSMKEYIGVYVPQSYAFAGHLYLIKPERVRPLTEVSAADALKFAVSGGVTEVEEHHEHNS